MFLEGTLVLSLWPYCFKTHLLVLKDVLGRISRQPSWGHADHLYDTILASLDTLAGCSLTPDSISSTQERRCEGD